MPANAARQGLRDDQPSIKVLIVSGYAETVGIAPEMPRLTKPFRNADLAASLAGLATRGEPGRPNC